MISIMGAVYQKAPLCTRVFDVVADKGALCVCTELCAHGSLQDIIMSFGAIQDHGWLVSHVRIVFVMLSQRLPQHGCCEFSRYLFVSSFPTRVDSRVPCRL
jgi:hypothetical protein